MNPQAVLGDSSYYNLNKLRSKMEIKRYLFCILLDLRYLCMQILHAK